LETLHALVDLHVHSGEGEEAEFLLGQTLRTLEAQCGPHNARSIACAEKLATLTQVPCSSGDQVWGLVPRSSDECLSVGSCTPRDADPESECAAWDGAVEATNCNGTNAHVPLLEDSEPESTQAKTLFQAYESESCNGNDCVVKTQDGHSRDLVWDTTKTPAGSGYPLPVGSDLEPLSNLTTRPAEGDTADFQTYDNVELRACSCSPRSHSLWNGGMEMSQELPQGDVELCSSTGHGGGIRRSVSA